MMASKDLLNDYDQWLENAPEDVDRDDEPNPDDIYEEKRINGELDDIFEEEK